MAAVPNALAATLKPGDENGLAALCRQARTPEAAGAHASCGSPVTLSGRRRGPKLNLPGSSDSTPTTKRVPVKGLAALSLDTAGARATASPASLVDTNEKTDEDAVDSRGSGSKADGGDGSGDGADCLTIPQSPPTVLHLDSVGSDNDLELHPEDFEILEGDVGAGAGGIVKKVLHRPTGIIMAQKLMHVEPKPDKQRMLLRELQFTKQCQHENIVEYFGAYHDKGEIYLCMEYMNCGALNDVLRKAGPLPEHVVAQIAVGIINGLIYLKTNHRVMHRDIKPSNVLINTDGAIKVCDFGVSGVLDLNSMAASFVGTQSYMAPERLEGKTYMAQSDVWSLGLTLLELVLGRYPFHPEIKTKTRALREPTLFELLNLIVTKPPPNVPSDRGFTEDFQEFIRLCLMKDEKMRPTPSSLRNHPWIMNAEEQDFNLKDWIASLPVELKRPDVE